MIRDPFEASLRPVLMARPTDWEVGRFGVEFTESNERNGDTPIGPMLSVSSYRGVYEQPSDAGQKPSSDVSGYRVVRPGQLAVNMMWLNFGGLAVSDLAGYISPAYKAFNVSPRLHGRFAHYLLRSRAYIDAFASLGQGVRPNSQMVASALLSMLPLLIPPMDDQRRIAAHLDRENAEIDALEADLDSLLGMLRLRRLATIDDEMRSHQVVPAALLANVTLGKMLQPTQQSRNEVLRPYLRAAHVQPLGRLDLTVEPNEMWFAPHEIEQFTIRRGDVVVVEGGVGGYGRAAYVAADVAGWAFQNSIVRLRAGSPSDGRYLAHALVAARERGDIAVECSASTMPHFTAEKVSRFRVPFHSPRDRSAIADRLDRSTAEMDDMIADAQRLKALLAERRSTLITDVVTGRKKVA